MMRCQGMTASGGLARGRILWLRPEPARGVYEPRLPEEERIRFEHALAQATEELRQIAAQAAGEAAAILEFQIALLDDEDFLAPARHGMVRGQNALDAWTEALNRAGRDYRSGGDAVLDARSDDLLDLQDRVARAIAGCGADTAMAADSPAMAAILVADSLTPSRFLALDFTRLRGIATASGSPHGHVALLARAHGLPMIVGCGAGLQALAEGHEVLLDADRGMLVSAADAGEEAAFAARLAERAAARTAATGRPEGGAATAMGEPVRICANLDHPALPPGCDLDAFDGIGLVRSEFLFEGDGLPDEDRQYAVYRAILETARGRPVTIRILDVGGDKPLPGISFAAEENPFLGLRGIRLFAHHPEIFRTQIRALLRAAIHGDLRIMVPLVSVPPEMAAFRREAEALAAGLCASGIPCRLPPLGMMVEVPSAALLAREFDADFLSIGTNDLQQYVLAAARGEHRLVALADAGRPALLRLIELVVAAGWARDVEVSVCGDMASTPEEIASLLRAGIRCLSVSPAMVSEIKQAVRAWPRPGENG